MSENTDKTKIATLVFMDLETTGLPSHVGKKNVHITEMSFIAIDRNSFESDQNLRALNKLSLCIRPRSVVSHCAMSITGLYNDVLEPQKEFDDSVPKLLEYFFRRLQVPICLLAHNGMKFDFPILQAELKRINYALDSHILCADTIQVLRSIFSVEKKVKNLCPEEEPLRKEIDSTSAVDEIDILLSQDMECFANIECLSEANWQGAEPVSKEPVETVPKEKSENKVQSTDSELLDPKENEKTPINHKSKQPVLARKRKMADQFSKTGLSSAKRALFPKPQTITKFSLESLYTHFFNEHPPQSHYAEMDCISLSKVCQRAGSDFLDWIDANSAAFCAIEALW